MAPGNQAQQVASLLLFLPLGAVLVWCCAGVVGLFGVGRVAVAAAGWAAGDVLKRVRRAFYAVMLGHVCSEVWRAGGVLLTQ
jgi:hypothetical protein